MVAVLINKILIKQIQKACKTQCFTGFLIGAPERSRTSGTRFRKPLLYPTELRAHISTLMYFITFEP